MLCEKCHKREAVVKFTQVIGNEKKTLNLCKECSEEQGLSNPLLDISKVFGKIIIAILSEHLVLKADKKLSEEDKQQMCGSCGLSWADFKTTGRLGCSQCYNAFMENMKVLLRRLHGTNRHIGKKLETDVEKKRESLVALERRLRQAVEKEEYELAAELRDRIRELYQEKQGTSPSCPT